LSWESASFAMRRSGVQIPSAPPFKPSKGSLFPAYDTDCLADRSRQINRHDGANPSARRLLCIKRSRPTHGTPVCRLALRPISSRRQASTEEDPMAKFANILETVGHTPVIRINKLAPNGINLFVKNEAFNPLGSVKDRLALGVIEAAEKSGELKPGQTVIEATSGNTGIGLAMVCAAKGYPLVVTIAETFSVERRKLMRFLGAKVVLTPAADRAVGMVNKAVELAKAHGWFLTRQFENEANPDMHSRTTAREIIEDFKGERLDYWV